MSMSGDLSTTSKSYQRKLMLKAPQRISRCISLFNEAEDYGADPFLAVSIAARETRFNPKLISSVGAVGIMQVIPRYGRARCAAKGIPRKDCTYRVMGFEAIDYFMGNSTGGLCEALAKYNFGSRGSCEGGGGRYARQVMKLYALLVHTWEKLC